MTLFEHKMALLKWIRSSDTAEQLELLQTFISKCVVPRFKKELSRLKDDKKKNMSFDLETTKTELSEAIHDRKLILAAS